MKALTHEQALSPDLTRPQIGPVRTQSDLEEALAGPLSVGVVWDAYPSAALPWHGAAAKGVGSVSSPF